MYYKRQHKEFDIFIMLPRARQQERDSERKRERKRKREREGNEVEAVHGSMSECNFGVPSARVFLFYFLRHTGIRVNLTHL